MLCYKSLSDIGKVRHLLSNKNTELLVHAAVGSRLDYCNSLLYGSNKTLINKLQKVQNAGARLISRRRKCRSVSDVLVSLHWLRVEARIVFKHLVFVFKCIHHMASEYLVDLIEFHDVDRLLLTYCHPKLVEVSVILRPSFGIICQMKLDLVPLWLLSKVKLNTFFLISSITS